MSVGADLRETREHAGLTERQAADTLGWPVLRVQALESEAWPVSEIELRLLGKLYGRPQLGREL